MASERGQYARRARRRAGQDRQPTHRPAAIAPNWTGNHAFGGGISYAYGNREIDATGITAMLRRASGPPRGRSGIPTGAACRSTSA